MKNKILLTVLGGLLVCTQINAFKREDFGQFVKEIDELEKIKGQLLKSDGTDYETLLKKANDLIAKINILDPTRAKQAQEVLVTYVKEEAPQLAKELEDGIEKVKVEEVAEKKQLEDSVKKEEEKAPGRTWMAYLKMKVDYSKWLIMSRWKKMINAYNYLFKYEAYKQTMLEIQKATFADANNKSIAIINGIYNCIGTAIMGDKISEDKEVITEYKQIPYTLRDKFFAQAVILTQDFEMDAKFVEYMQALSKLVIQAVTDFPPQSDENKKLVKEYLEPIYQMAMLFEGIRSNTQPPLEPRFNMFASNQIITLCEQTATLAGVTFDKLTEKEGLLTQLKNTVFNNKKKAMGLVVLGGLLVAYKYEDYLSEKLGAWVKTGLEATVGNVVRRGKSAGMAVLSFIQNAPGAETVANAFNGALEAGKSLFNYVVNMRIVAMPLARLGAVKEAVKERILGAQEMPIEQQREIQQQQIGAAIFGEPIVNPQGL
jgi:hypothetical protein